MPRRCCLLSASTLLLFLAVAPAAEPEPAVIARLIAKLGDDDFAVREAAGQRLLQLGEVALPRLDAAVRERSVEFGGPEFAGWRHVAKLPVMHGFNEGGRINGRALLDGLDDNRPQINNAVVLGTRLSGRLRSVTGSVLIVNGDLDYI